MKTIILYMPVIHRGYLDLFSQIDPDVIGLLTEDVISALSDESISYIKKKDSIRAVSSNLICRALAQITSAQVFCADEQKLFSIADTPVLMPDEDVNEVIAGKYFKEGVVTFVTTPKLRYHRKNAESQSLVVPDVSIDQKYLDTAFGVASKSPDWWRQVGGVLLANDGTTIVGFNEHPDKDYAAAFGDPRSLFTSGIHTNLSFAEHAERVLISEASRRKICTDESVMYLSTFPCMPCAQMIYRAGIKKLFYRDPSYGLLDADEYLRLRGVELVSIN